MVPTEGRDVLGKIKISTEGFVREGLDPTPLTGPTQGLEVVPSFFTIRTNSIFS